LCCFFNLKFEPSFTGKFHFSAE